LRVLQIGHVTVFSSTSNPRLCHTFKVAFVEPALWWQRERISPALDTRNFQRGNNKVWYLQPLKELEPDGQLKQPDNQIVPVPN